jgi:glycosyltransferase involved in cell wall biosynthesis
MGENSSPGGPDVAAERGGAIAELELGPPATLAVGRGTAFAVGGHAYAPGQRTRDLAIRLDRDQSSLPRIRLPRVDVHQRLAPGDPAVTQAYRSGFVGVVDIAPIEHRERRVVELILTLSGGREERVAVGELELLPELARPPDAGSAGWPGGGPRVAICMASYEPPPALLHRQLESVREQSHRNWICLISDDGSSDAAFGHLLREIGDDPRFVVSHSERRRGFYRNFERALSMAPPSADFVTLCDQDDRWLPEKLARLIDAIGGAQLAYSDTRVVRPGGEEVSPSYWTERRNNYTNFASLLLANSVTGAASLYRRDLLDDALPFPPRLTPKAFHDHWLAVVALARGEIAYVDDPLYEYVQHGGAVIGHTRANKRPRPLRTHLIERLRNPTGGSRAVYYYDWHQQLLFAEVLRLRCWDRMAPGKRRTLRRLLSADERVASLAWLIGRRARRLWGHDETLDRELFYGHALLRRRAVSALAAGRRRPSRVLPRDASIPPAPADGDAPP